MADGSTITANNGVLSAVNVGPSPDVGSTVFGKSGDLTIYQYTDDDGVKHVVYGAEIPGKLTIMAAAAIECAAEIAAYNVVVEGQFDAVEAEIDAMGTDVAGLDTAMTEVQSDVSDLSSTAVQTGPNDEERTDLILYAPESEENPLLT
jgi:hypothetical protein